jgi:protein O-GlcNAc transferase
MRDWLLQRLKRRADTLLSPQVPSAPGTPSAPSPPSAPAPSRPAPPQHQTLLAAGDLSQAETVAKAALDAEPADAAAALTLCRVAVLRRKLPEARKAVERLRELAPGSAVVDWQQGALDLLAGRRETAQAALEAAVQKDPLLGDALFLLASLWLQRGDTGRALALLQQAVRASPDHAAARNDLGNLLRQAGRGLEAAAHFEASVAADPRLQEAWFNLGTLRLDMGRFADAAQALEKSVALQAAQADAHYWLGHARMGAGDAAAARRAYAQALKLDAQFLRARWALTMAQIQPVPSSQAEEAASRTSFGDALGQLANWVRTRAPAQAFEAVAVTQPYYLAYQEANPRELLARYGSLCTQAMAPWQKKAGLLPTAAEPMPAWPLRVGIVSAHLHDHSVWNAIVRGWLENFDRSRCELHLFSLGGQEDAQSRFARSQAASFQPLAAGWQAAAHTLQRSRMQVLIYPEVGMDSSTGKLAAMRLAPVQVASWGHPVTTGLPTIDHYVSAQAFESSDPAEAAAHYSERLHMLPRLGCTPRRYGTRPARVDLQALGVPAGVPVLLCAGTPFKYTPRHDALWLEVARRCAPCRLVFFRGQPAALSARLELRLRTAFGEAGLDFDEHVVFVPWQSQEGFFGLLRAAHVFLDNPGFSGFNTVMQALECGTPIVAHAGSTMRANLGVGVLRQLGLGDWVATDHDGYADRVQSLCRDATLRSSLSQALQRGSETLFADRAASVAMQTLLEKIAQGTVETGRRQG